MIASAGWGRLRRQALLPAGAVDPRISPRTVVAEGVIAVAAIGFLSVAAGRLVLRLAQIVGTALTCIVGAILRLIQPSPVLILI